MKMKKLAAWLLTGAMALSLIGCGKAPAGGETYTVGICQLVQHEALDAATEGFKAALTDRLGDKVTFDEQNASGDPATCATIANQFVANKVDLIMANATPALQAAVAATEEIPIVATSVTDYATALDIAEWTGKTGMNVTGTADLAPLEEQAAMIKELVPNVQKVGILYNSAEANSKYQATVIGASLDAMGIAYEEYTSADSNDIALVTQAAVEACDVLYVPTDNSMASNAEIVNNIAEPAGVPIIAGEEGICKGCGIATLSIDYYSIGYRAGEMAADILEKGSNPAEMDIDFAKDLTKKYMADRCETLNITVPADYEAITVE